MASAGPPDWLVLAVDEALVDIADADMRAQAVERVLTKYVPAASRAASDAARERAWSALFHFLTARPAPRRPWQVGEGSAAGLIERLSAALPALRTEEPRT